MTSQFHGNINISVYVIPLAIKTFQRKSVNISGVKSAVAVDVRRPEQLQILPAPAEADICKAVDTLDLEKPTYGWTLN